MPVELNKLILNRYILSRHIASGGMADIYEAQDIVLNKVVAIKFLKECFLDDFSKIEQFKNEARFTAMFSHPHIMKIYNVGEYNRLPYVSYELLRGKTLKEVLDNRGKLTYDEAIDFTLQMLDAISNMHEKEIIHNDLKPDNVFMQIDGNIKVFDLGIATHTFDKEQKEIFGSLNYFSPEVLQNRKYSVQSDIYSVGIMLFEFLTGRVPFYGDDIKEIINKSLKEEVPSIKKYVTLNDSDSLDYVISKATNKNASNRYKSCKEFSLDLNKILKHEKLGKGLFSRLFR